MTHDELIRLLQSENPDDVRRALKYAKTLISKKEKITDEILILMLKSKVEGVDNTALKYIINNKQKNVTSKLRIPSHIKKDAMFNDALLELWKYVRKRDFDTSKKDAIERFLYVVCQRYVWSQPGESPNIDELPELFEYMIISSMVHEQREKLREIFDQLGTGCKEILTYRYFADMSYKEIAEIADYTKDSARVKASNCMSKLRQAIFNNPNLGNYIRGLLKLN